MSTPGQSAGNSPATLQSLETALKESAAATKALAALLTRDPKLDFRYGRDSTGIIGDASSFRLWKARAYSYISSTTTPAEDILDAGVQLVEVAFSATANSAAFSSYNFYTTNLLVMMANTPDFPNGRTEIFLVPPTKSAYTFPTLIDPVTGVVTNTGSTRFDWFGRFPVRSGRYIRVFLWDMTNPGGIPQRSPSAYTLVSPNGAGWSFWTPIWIHQFGQ